MNRCVLVAATFVAPLILSVTTPALSDDGTGAGITVAAFAVKRACDQAIPGFSEDTNAMFEKYKAEDADFIALVETAGFEGQSFDGYVETLSEQLLQQPRMELEKTCQEFAKKLGVPTNAR